MKKIISYPVLLIVVMILNSCCCCNKPDLKVEDLVVTWTDEEQKVSFKVHNVGESDADEFLVYVNLEEEPVSPNHRPQLRENITELAAGELKEFNNLDLSHLAHPDNNLLGNVYKIVVLADPKGQIDECDEENNTIEKEVSKINKVCMWHTGFEPLAVGTEYTTINTTFTSDDIEFKTLQFNPVSATGSVRVQNEQYAGGSGNDTWTRNMNIEFILPNSVNYISFKACHYGGKMNLGINGSLHNFNDVGSINGMNLGGVLITTTGSHNTPGKWEFNGLITSFYVGGQEFVIDDVCIK